MIQNIQAYVGFDGQKNHWVFDDEEKGLQREGLVLGVDDYLDALCLKYHLNEKIGVSVNFSHDVRSIYNHRIDHPVAKGISTRVVNLELVCDYNNGYTYLIVFDPILKREDEAIWLCGNLLKYFDAPPKELFVTFDEVMVVDVAKMIAVNVGKLLISSNSMEIVYKAMLEEQFLDEFSPLLGKHASIKWYEYHLISD